MAALRRFLVVLEMVLHMRKSPQLKLNRTMRVDTKDLCMALTRQVEDSVACSSGLSVLPRPFQSNGPLPLCYCKCSYPLVPGDQGSILWRAFFPSLFQLESWHGFNPYQIPIFSYHSFSFLTLIFRSFVLLSPILFYPPLISSSPFLFSFSYSFPIRFPSCFLFSSPFFYSPDFFLLSLPYCFCFLALKFLSCFTSLPRGLIWTQRINKVIITKG